MPERMPVVFVSHGAPDALLKAPDAVACWGEIGRSIPRPAAILVVSAHWEARQPTASLSDSPETIHDFSGFSPDLYRMQYRAPGAPALAERAMSLLTTAGLAVDSHLSRGLDHGAWVPLSAMYPQADVPVTQLSLVRDADPATHFELGRAFQKWDRFHESHAEDILVHYPDGHTSKGLQAHIEELKPMFVFAPDTRIRTHPVKFGSGEWTSVIGVLEGTFTQPMPIGGGKTIAPTGKPFKLTMSTVGHWTKAGVMDEEYLFWDNQDFMKQIGLAP